MHSRTLPAGQCKLLRCVGLGGAGTNSLTCVPKHGGVQVNKFLVSHPMTD
jgi:hypothetical protein